MNKDDVILSREQLKKLRIEFHKTQGQHDNWSDYVAQAQTKKIVDLLESNLDIYSDECLLLGSKFWQQIKEIVNE